MAFELFVLQLFFLLMAGFILYINRSMLGKESSFTFFTKNKRSF